MIEITFFVSNTTRSEQAIYRWIDSPGANWRFLIKQWTKVINWSLASSYFSRLLSQNTDQSTLPLICNWIA